MNEERANRNIAGYCLSCLRATKEGLLNLAFFILLIISSIFPWRLYENIVVIRKLYQEDDPIDRRNNLRSFACSSILLTICDFIAVPAGLLCLFSPRMVVYIFLMGCNNRFRNFQFEINNESMWTVRLVSLRSLIVAFFDFICLPFVVLCLFSPLRFILSCRETLSNFRSYLDIYANKPWDYEEFSNMWDEIDGLWYGQAVAGVLDVVIIAPFAIFTLFFPSLYQSYYTAITTVIKDGFFRDSSKAVIDDFNSVMMHIRMISALQLAHALFDVLSVIFLVLVLLSPLRYKAFIKDMQTHFSDATRSEEVVNRVAMTTFSGLFSRARSGKTLATVRSELQQEEQRQVVLANEIESILSNSGILDRGDDELSLESVEMDPLNELDLENGDVTYAPLSRFDAKSGYAVDDPWVTVDDDSQSVHSVLTRDSLKRGSLVELARSSRMSAPVHYDIPEAYETDEGMKFNIDVLQSSVDESEHADSSWWRNHTNKPSLKVDIPDVEGDVSEVSENLSVVESDDEKKEYDGASTQISSLAQFERLLFRNAHYADFGFCYNAKLRWLCICYGLNGILDILMVPLWIPLLITRYRMKCLREANLLVSCLWGWQEYLLAFVHMALLYSDLICLPFALLIFITQIRWKPVSDAVSMCDLSREDTFIVYHRVARAVRLLFCDFLCFPLVFICTVTRYRSEPIWTIWNSPLLWHSGDASGFGGHFVHITIIYNFLVIFHDCFILFPCSVITICSGYRAKMVLKIGGAVVQTLCPGVSMKIRRKIRKLRRSSVVRRNSTADSTAVTVETGENEEYDLLAAIKEQMDTLKLMDEDGSVWVSEGMIGRDHEQLERDSQAISRLLGNASASSAHPMLSPITEERPEDMFSELGSSVKPVNLNSPFAAYAKEKSGKHTHFNFNDVETSPASSSKSKGSIVIVDEGDLEKESIVHVLWRERLWREIVGFCLDIPFLIMGLIVLLTLFRAKSLVQSLYDAVYRHSHQKPNSEIENEDDRASLHQSRFVELDNLEDLNLYEWERRLPAKIQFELLVQDVISLAPASLICFTVYRAPSTFRRWYAGGVFSDVVWDEAWLATQDIFVVIKLILLLFSPFRSREFLNSILFPNAFRKYTLMQQCLETLNAADDYLYEYRRRLMPILNCAAKDGVASREGALLHYGHCKQLFCSVPQTIPPGSVLERRLNIVERSFLESYRQLTLQAHLLLASDPSFAPVKEFFDVRCRLQDCYIRHLIYKCIISTEFKDGCTDPEKYSLILALVSESSDYYASSMSRGLDDIFCSFTHVKVEVQTEMERAISSRDARLAALNAANSPRRGSTRGRAGSIGGENELFSPRGRTRSGSMAAGDNELFSPRGRTRSGSMAAGDDSPLTRLRSNSIAGKDGEIPPPPRGRTSSVSGDNPLGSPRGRKKMVDNSDKNSPIENPLVSPTSGSAKRSSATESKFNFDSELSPGGSSRARANSISSPDGSSPGKSPRRRSTLHKREDSSLFAVPLVVRMCASDCSATAKMLWNTKGMVELINDLFFQSILDAGFLLLLVFFTVTGVYARSVWGHLRHAHEQDQEFHESYPELFVPFHELHNKDYVYVIDDGTVWEFLKKFRIGNYRVRRILLEHMQQFLDHVHYVAEIAVYIVGTLVMVVDAPGMLSEMFFRTNYFLDFLACLKQHFRHSLSIWSGVFCTCTSGSFVKLILRTLRSIILYPAACISEVSRWAKDDPGYRLVWGMLIWVILLAMSIGACVFIGQEQLDDSAYNRGWISAVTVLALLAILIGVAGINMEKKDYYRFPSPSTLAHCLLSWSHIFGLLVGPFETIQLCSLVIYFYWNKETRGFAGFNGWFLFATNQDNDTEMYHFCLNVAILLVCIWGIVVALPLALKGDPDIKRLKAAALYASPLFDALMIIITQGISVWIMFTLMRPITCAYYNNRTGEFTPTTNYWGSEYPNRGAYSLRMISNTNIPCGGDDSRSHTALVFLVFFVITSCLIHPITAELYDPATSLFEDGTPQYHGGRVRIAPLFSVVLKLMQFSVVVISCTAASVYDAVLPMMLCLSVSSIAAFFISTFRGEACNIPGLVTVRLFGWMAVMWTASLCIGRRWYEFASDYRTFWINSYLLFAGYWIIGLVGFFYFVNDVFAHQRKLAAHYTELGVDKLVGTMVEMAATTIDENAIMPVRRKRFELDSRDVFVDLTSDQKAHEHVGIVQQFINSVQHTKSASQLARFLIEFEEQVRIDKLSFPYLIGRDKWRNQLRNVFQLVDSVEFDTYNLVLAATNSLADSLTFTTITGSYLYEIFLLSVFKGVPRSVSWIIFSFLVDADNLRAVIHPLLNNLKPLNECIAFDSHCMIGASGNAIGGYTCFAQFYLQQIRENVLAFINDIDNLYVNLPVPIERVVDVGYDEPVEADYFSKPAYQPYPSSVHVIQTRETITRSRTTTPNPMGQEYYAGNNGLLAMDKNIYGY